MPLTVFNTNVIAITTDNTKVFILLLFYGFILLFVSFDVAKIEGGLIIVCYCNVIFTLINCLAKIMCQCANMPMPFSNTAQPIGTLFLVFDYILYFF